jgi:hypothetical protein
MVGKEGRDIFRIQRGDCILEQEAPHIYGVRKEYSLERKQAGPLGGGDAHA